MGKCVVVLGLHRSGTSSVAGVLHHLGVNMGDKMLPPDDKAPTGYYEDQDFLDIHNVICGDCRNPTIDTTTLAIEYQNLLAKKSTQSLWGVKDPKMCFLFPYFLKTITNTEILVVEVNRNIDAVAKSLQKYLDYSVDLNEAQKICSKYEEAKKISLTFFQGKHHNINYEKLVENAPNVVSDFVEKKLC